MFIQTEISREGNAEHANVIGRCDSVLSQSVVNSAETMLHAVHYNVTVLQVLLSCDITYTVFQKTAPFLFLQTLSILGRFG